MRSDNDSLSSEKSIVSHLLMKWEVIMMVCQERSQ